MARVLLNTEKNEIVNGNSKIYASDFLKNAHAGKIQNVPGLQNFSRVLDRKIENVAVVPEPVVTKSAGQTPFTIEEENSSDNFPAIGHLEGFEIQTAEDGSLLPSTVNAKMADGSYQRLTLYPQFVDGNVTCTVQFENDPQEKLATEKNQSAIDKIDRLILQNENIIKRSELGKRKDKLLAASMENAIPPRSLKNDHPATAIIPPSESCNRKRTSSDTQRSISGTIRGPDILKRIRKEQPQQSVLKSSCLQPVTSQPQGVYAANSFNMKMSKAAFRYPDRKALQSFPFTDASHSKPKAIQTILGATQNDLLTVKDRKTQKNLILGADKKTTVHSEVAYQFTDPSSASEGPLLVKCPRSENNEPVSREAPLGSALNPITLVQNGGTFQSKQPLSEVQLRQISAILKKHKSSLSSDGESNIFIDPATKSKITYKVVYPNDDLQPAPEGAKTITKRGRKKKTSSNNENCSSDGSPVLNCSQKSNMGEKVNGKDRLISNEQAAKVLKVARTRSGRLSRPPQHIVDEYKNMETDSERAHAPTDDILSSQNASLINPSPTPVIPINQYLSHRRTKKMHNVKAEFRCRTCKKVYLGHNRMMMHLRKFPDHSNVLAYALSLNKSQPPIKTTFNKRKLTRMVKNTDKSVYGPLLAKAFNMWEFLLLRVGLMQRTGQDEVESLLQELYGLLEKMSRVLEELLIPVYEHEDGQDDNYVNLDKHNVAYALGMAQGTYKVNPAQRHLLRLINVAEAQESPQPAQPPPPEPRIHLATKFEPNLSNKLLDEDSIDLDCSSKDVETEDDNKKDWTSSDKVDDTNSEFLSEFLENDLPSGPDDGIAMWKEEREIDRASLPVESDSSWKVGIPVRPGPDEQPELWKDGESPCAANNGDLWKQATAVKRWPQESVLWKHGTDSMWKDKALESEAVLRNSLKEESWNKSRGGRDSNAHQDNVWGKRDKREDVTWETSTDGVGKEVRKDWLRWKEDGGVSGVSALAGMRTSRLTSTPEATVASALLSPPLRRNSVSSFAQNHQEELLSLDLHELFDDLIPETKPRPKPGSIESIINEALFTGNGPPPSHSSLPSSLIPDSLDNLDFLNT